MSPLEPSFHKIAKRYDQVNRILSVGIDVYWRYYTAKSVVQTLPLAKRIVDLATGSGDLAFAMRKRFGEATDILGLDIAPEMLAIAQQKCRQYPSSKGPLHFKYADAQALPLEDASIDGVTVAFGLRNFQDRVQGLREIYRVLKPQGAVWILEFSHATPILRPFYTFYLKHILPVLGGALTGSFESYRYLCESIQAFPTQSQLAEQLRAVGFKKVSYTNLTGGIVALHHAWKQ